MLPGYAENCSRCLGQRLSDARRCQDDQEIGKLGPLHGEFWKDFSAVLPCGCGYRAMTKDDAQRLRKDAWGLLPEWMGFGSWDEILVSQA